MGGPVRRRLRAFDPQTLAFRLYALLSLAVVSLIALAWAGVHFSRLTVDSAHRLSGAGLHGIVMASELEILLEKHRRIVEAAPAEVDRARLTTAQTALGQIEAQLRDLVTGRQGLPTEPIANRLPQLTAQAGQVMFFAVNLAQDKAQDAVDVYQLSAAALQATIRNIRSEQAAAADTMVERLSHHADGLLSWATAAALIALVGLGPIGLLVLGDSARRLERLWRVMRQLAGNDTAIPVPSLTDRDEIGDMARAVQVFKDNAVQLSRHRGEIEQVNGWLDIALNNMARGLSMFDGQRRLVLCNASYRAMYDVPPALAVRGTPADQILAFRAEQTARFESVKPGVDGAISLAALLATRAPQSAYQHLRDGRIIEIAVQPLVDGGWVAVHEDVTRQREAEQRIFRLARVDTLTGLANRLVFREDLERRCAADGRDQAFALLVIDLDHFKLVNDTFGHPAGDALLEAVSTRLRGLTRERDLVARLGGDEFAVLQDNVTSPAAAVALAGRIIAELSRPYDLAGVTAHVGASVGIALAPRDGLTASQLFGHADLALYQSKEAGRGGFTEFDVALKDKVTAQRTLERELGEALALGQFELHYQPIVDLTAGTVVCCEALLRWRHPVRGLVPPLAFLPQAEAAGLMAPIGRWALLTACRDAQSWPETISVAVNFSATQVLAGNLADEVRCALTVSGLAAHRLELEVTETVLLQDAPSTREALLAVRELGVRIALDDFGTGYASLSYLRRFPFDKLKIDQMFVRDVPEQAASVAIIRAVAALAASLDMVSVAEGVETLDHLQRVAAAGCTQVQGYLFSRPVPAAAVPEAIARCTAMVAARIAA